MNAHLGAVAVRPAAIVGPDDSAGHALRSILTECSPEVCVLDARGRFLGLVTDSELLKAALNGTLAELRVAQLMHRNPHTLTADQTLADAARLFRDGSLSRVPVLRGDYLVGLVRRCDVLRCFANEVSNDDDAAIPAPQFLATVGRCAVSCQ